MFILIMNCKYLLILFLVMMAYMAIGGLVFSLIEIGNEERTKSALRSGLRDFLRNHSCVTLEDIDKLFLVVGDDIKLARLSVHNGTVKSMWDFTGASVFAMSAITTIGYGNLAPKTSLGQAICVVYAFIGIPLMMILLKEIGEKLHCAADKIYHYQYFKNGQCQQKIFKGILLSTLSCLIVIGLPAYLFSHAENWTMSEAVYFCFITLSTIGFGDFVAAEPYKSNGPQGDIGRTYRWFVFLWIIVGLSFLSLVISLLTKLITNKASCAERFTRETLENQIEKLKHELEIAKKSYSFNSVHNSSERMDEANIPEDVTNSSVTLINFTLLKSKNQSKLDVVANRNDIEEGKYSCSLKSADECEDFKDSNCVIGKRDSINVVYCETDNTENKIYF